MPESGVHEVLLASADAHTRTVVAHRLRSAQRHRHKIVTVAAPVDGFPGTLGPVTAMPVDELHRPAASRDLIDRAIDEGFDGLSVLVWADALVAEASADVHADLETDIARLSRTDPLSALCVYGRSATDTVRLAAAVERHPDGLLEEHLVVRRDGQTLALRGEIDMSNVEIPASALPHLGVGSAEARVDLTGLTFLSVDAVRVLIRQTAAYRDQGGSVELAVESRHTARLLDLLDAGRQRGMTVEARAAR